MVSSRALSALFESKNFKYFTVAFIIVLILYMTHASLNPLNTGMFKSHDGSQVARVSSFVDNLKAGNIPPRLAPDFSFNLGFPVFNFYAPTAYWITSAIALLGATSIMAVKISFLLTVIFSFLAMLYLLTRYFDYYSSILGASAYVTSTYFATEIIIRGNLAESWFLVFFPLVLGLLKENSKTFKKSVFVLSTLSAALLFTSHNMLSLVSMPIVVIYSLLLPHRKRNLFVLGIAILLDSYFLIPAYLESSLVQAKAIAKVYNYKEHFLCPWQLWTAHGWQFGGSWKGCEADMMSFKIGRLHMILGFLGVITLLFKVTKGWKKISHVTIYLSVAVLTIFSFLLTLEVSRFVWLLFEPLMALFQFPWRFLVFAMFGCAFFSAYLFDVFKPKAKYLLILVITCLLFLSGQQYFVKPLIEHAEYNDLFNSVGFKNRHVAFMVREYLPIDVTYSYWHYLNPSGERSRDMEFDYTQPVDFRKSYTIEKDTQFNKRVVTNDEGILYVNVHNFPNWNIYQNGIKLKPERFDHLARPELLVAKGDVITVQYKQTRVQIFGNTLTIASLIGLFYLLDKHKRLLT